MLDCETIVKLYSKVLDNDISRYNILEREIRIGIRRMAEVYKPMRGKKMVRSVVVNFNDIAHRCAYLHKCASLHTAMVRDFLFSAIRRNYDFFSDLLLSESPFKMCSLGGGPGSDVLGVLASLMDTFNHRQDLDISVTVIDCMVKWSETFNSVIKELTSGMYGNSISPVAAGQSLRWRYMGADLLQTLDPEVEREISSASLITAIKFVSAANCNDTELMVENIFSAMKPGAVIFFIDNAGGGFRDIILDSAVKFNFIPIFGPFRCERYSNEVMKVRRFRTISCHETLVSVAILQKPHEIQPKLRITLPNERGDQFPGSGHSRKVEDYNFSSSTGFSTSPDMLPDAAILPDIPLVPDESNREDDHACVPNQNDPLKPSEFQHHDRYFTVDPVGTEDSASCSENAGPSFIRDTAKLDCDGILTKNGHLRLSKIKHRRSHLSSKFHSFKSHSRKKHGKNLIKRSINHPK